MKLRASAISGAAQAQQTGDAELIAETSPM